MILIKTSNPSRKKLIDRVSRVSDDKLEEIKHIIELLDNSDLTNEDIKSLKWYIFGYLEGKQKKRVILKVNKKQI